MPPRTVSSSKRCPPPISPGRWPGSRWTARQPPGSRFRGNGSPTSPPPSWLPKPPASPAGPWIPRPSTPRSGNSSASRSEASRRSSTCAPRCCCGPNRLRSRLPMPLRLPLSTLLHQPTHSCRSRRRSRRQPESMPRRATLRTASRCWVESASPGSMTRICICAARMGSHSSWVAARTIFAVLRR